MEDRKGIVPPSEGWKAHSWYVVIVSYFKGNPEHEALFHTGFLNDDGEPSGYNCIVPMNGTADHKHTAMHEVRYLEAIECLYTVDKSF